MNSELHERLEYLVNFSSQLIFVSGDSISDQQRTLETFIYQQHDNTEVAYLTTEPELDISDYRRQLCRQLLGQVIGSFVRPLNELLADLNKHEGPILIAIMQAHHLPDKLLQELWELVLQSRFAGNKQHLNVLLFGDPEWAEKAKQWLPAKNSSTPLLIGSQSVSQPHNESELEAMITKRRQQFHEHLARRHNPPAALDYQTPFTNKWFWLAMAVLLLTLVAAMLSWMYGETLSTLFDEPQSVQTTQDSRPPPDVISIDVDDTVDSSNSKNDQDSTPIIDLDALEPEIPVNHADPLTATWDEALVATAALSAAKASTPPEKDITLSLIASTQAPSETPAQSEPQSQTAEVDVTQPVVPANTSTSEASITPVTVQTTDTQIENVPVEQSPPIEEVSETSNSMQDNDTIVTLLANDMYALQIAGLSDPDYLAQFMTQYQLADEVLVYVTQRYGGPWYVIVDKDFHTTQEDAQSEVASLPEFPGKEQVFVKSGQAILSEIAAAPTLP